MCDEEVNDFHNLIHRYSFLSQYINKELYQKKQMNVLEKSELYRSRYKTTWYLEMVYREREIKKER